MSFPDPALAVAGPDALKLSPKQEAGRGGTIRLVPLENYVAKAVLEASASVFAKLSNASGENRAKVSPAVCQLTRKTTAPGVSPV